MTTAAFDGPIADTALDSTLVFLGPTATVSTLASQRLTASATGSIRTTAADQTAVVAICAQPSWGGSVTFLGSIGHNVTLRANAYNIVSSSTSAVRGAGSWKVGLCAHRGSSNFTLAQNDYVSGLVQVTN